jgi:hypothetical protein
MQVLGVCARRRERRQKGTGDGERQEQRSTDGDVTRAQARQTANVGVLVRWLVMGTGILRALFRGGTIQSSGNRAPCERA